MTTDTLKAHAAAVGRWVAGQGAALADARAEVFTATAILAGWALLTAGVADLVPAPRAVWRVSAGLFLLLAFGGWRFLWKIASQGLYTMTRPRTGRDA